MVRAQQWRTQLAAVFLSLLLYNFACASSHSTGLLLSPGPAVSSAAGSAHTVEGVLSINIEYGDQTTRFVLVSSWVT